MGAATGTPAVVLLSGGLDSATVLALAQAAGHEVHALTFAYGQRHSAELEAAARVAEGAGIEDCRVATIDLRLFGGSALTADDLAVPKHGPDHDVAGGDDIPVTYVPARNTIFLSFALAFAEVIGARDIYLGVNALDYSGYPDCRPEYLDAFQAMANLATRAAIEGATVTIHAPLVSLTKAEIIRRGTELGVDYGVTLSCYDPTPAPPGTGSVALACGGCDACLLRRRGFAESGVADPTRYAR